MKILPLDERRRNRPVAFVIDAYKSRGVYLATPDSLRWIDADKLRQFDGIVYTFCRPSRLLAATDARQWTGYSWNGGINKMQLDGGPVFYPIATALRANRSDTEGQIEAAYALFAWLLKRAVVPGSISSMTWRLWRATLDKPVYLSRRRLLGTRALYGGRQEAPYPGDYQNCNYFDITAAYPTSMAHEPYPSELRDAGKHLGDGAGIASATVTIPQMEWSPLPVRLSQNALCYGYGTASGFWPWSDLRLARDVGCKVEIHESWQGTNDVDLFGEWWDVVREGRASVALSKSVTSRLWGAFSLSQKVGNMIRWSDADGKFPIKAPLTQRKASIPTAPYIAAETTARVRSRLYRDGILNVPDVLYVDTDAVINGGSVTPVNFGPEPGQWRMKALMVRCEIRGPQVFRHECPTCDRDHSKWHYVVSGAPSETHAIAAFNRTKRHKGQAMTAFTPGQVTLPAGPLERYATL